jgi:glycosyltransferase involved in cell wall biosynthesis
VLVPRRAWPDDRFPHWAVAALRAAGARVSETGARADVALVPALRPAARTRVRARRVIALADVPLRPGDERLDGVEVVATSAALAAPWRDARIVRPAVDHTLRSPVKQGVRPHAHARALRIVSVGPLHWSAGHEHAVVAAARLGAQLLVVGEGPAREEILFAAFDLGIERAVFVVAPHEIAQVRALDLGAREARGDAGGPGLAVAWADVVVVPAVEDRAWPAALQALADAVPLVTSDLPTLRELGVPSLVPPRDPAALADAITAAVASAPRANFTNLEACGRALLA